MQLSQVEKDLQHIGWAFSKNLKCNYATMKSFLKEALIDEIVIIGHSFLGVDEQYYRDILVPRRRFITIKVMRWQEILLISMELMSLI